MRRFLYIFAAILAYLALSSRSCGSDEPEEAVSPEAALVQSRDSIRHEFSAEDLSRKSLRAFELQAEQKLSDLADYLNINFNDSLDLPFREQARRMIRDLFLSDSVKINLLLFNEKKGNSLSLMEYLNLVPGPAGYSKTILLDSIEIERPLRRTDEFNYTGHLSFSRQIKTCSPGDTTTTAPLRMEVEILASKVSKIFGKDTLQVWGLFLGEIKRSDNNRD